MCCATCYTFVAVDALVLRVREGGRVVPVHALVITDVDVDGHRTTTEEVTAEQTLQAIAA